MINEQNAYAFCKEDIKLIENYEQAINDNENIWVCHHRRGTIYSANDLIAIGEYYHRPAVELIFMKREDHISLHSKIQIRDEKYRNAISEGLKKSDKFKKSLIKHNKSNKMRNICREMGKNNKGKPAWNKGKPYPHKGVPHTDKTKKHLSEVRKNKIWINDGHITKSIDKNMPIPDGFVRGRLFNKKKNPGT